MRMLVIVQPFAFILGLLLVFWIAPVSKQLAIFVGVAVVLAIEGLLMAMGIIKLPDARMLEQARLDAKAAGSKSKGSIRRDKP